MNEQTGTISLEKLDVKIINDLGRKENGEKVLEAILAGKFLINSTGKQQ